MLVYLATDQGFFTAASQGGWQVTSRGLQGQEVTAAAASPGSILAGTAQGIFRSEDGGQSWREAAGLTQPHVRWLAFDPQDPSRALAGTEPAAIFVSADGGASWRECGEVARLRDRFAWFLPYSPEAGCVRGFAFHGERVYAAVEVGGMLVSEDRGEIWRLVEGSSGHPSTGGPVEPMVHADVHSVESHPASPGLVYAPTGGGFYRSDDGGSSWRRCYDCYARAAWVDPTDSEHIVLGPADGVDRGGRIEESRDGGASWRPASGGLAGPWPRHMVERFTPLGADLLAVLSNGEALVRPLEGGEWRLVLDGVGRINAAAAGAE